MQVAVLILACSLNSSLIEILLIENYEKLINSLEYRIITEDEYFKLTTY